MRVAVRPDSREGHRLFPRLKAPVYYRPARFRTAFSPTQNVGSCGVRVYSDEPFNIGDRFNVELFISPDTSVAFLCRVVWTMQLPNSSAARYDVGLQLLDVNSDDLRSLSRVLESDAEFAI